MFLSFNFRTKKAKLQTVYRQLSKNYSKSLFQWLNFETLNQIEQFISSVETGTSGKGVDLSFFFVTINSVVGAVTSILFNIELIELSLIPEFF